MRQITWIEHIRSLQRPLNESPFTFVAQFSHRLDETIERFLKEQSALPLSSHRETSAQKALTHALQLYDAPSLLKLIANYDPDQEIQKISLKSLKKSLHSLRVIPSLENLTATPIERKALHAYATRLKNHLSHIFSCPPENLFQAEIVKQMLTAFGKRKKFDHAYANSFFNDRLNLLFSPEYRIYLILKNRYFLNHLLQEAEENDCAKWLHQILEQIEVPSGADLMIRLASVNFRTMEYLIQLTMRQLSQRATLSQDSPPPVLLEVISETENPFEKEADFSSPSASTIQMLREMENVPIAPPLAQESQNGRSLSSAPAPAQPLQRTLFEQLCLKYLKELLYLANHTELVTECSAPYFLPKLEEYVSDKHDFFENFFEPHPEVLEEFNRFATQLLQRTDPLNAFDIQKEGIGVYSWSEGEWHLVETQERNREWIVMLKSQLPFSMLLKRQNETAKIPKGRPFIIQFGKTYFDYNQPKPRWIETRPTSYFKVLLKGTQLVTDSAVIYAGNDPYYKLTDPQLWQWRGLILLYLIVARNKYSADLPEPLKNYLVKMIPSLLKPDS